jgi:DNA-binding MarR family transcriptional regulator
MSARGTERQISSATGYLLVRLGDLARRRIEDELRPWGISGKELHVLAYAREAPLSQRDLTALARMDRTTMTEVVNKLEGLGYVRRERNTADRRKYLITVTAEGGRVLGEALARLDKAETEFLASLTPIERSLLNNMVGRLHAAHDPECAE